MKTVIKIGLVVILTGILLFFYVSHYTYTKTADDTILCLVPFQADQEYFDTSYKTADEKLKLGDTLTAKKYYEKAQFIMTIQHIFGVLTFFLIYSCSTDTNKNENGLPEPSLEKSLKVGDYIFVTKDLDSNKHQIKPDVLPIHGTLNQKLIDQYYPKILDTIKDRRIIGSEPIDIQTKADIYVSMLHNTGTFDEMFLCTHDKNFTLLDSYYIGTSTTFDKTSHTIEYKKISDDRLEFHLVDWAYVKNEIDTIKYQKYILTIAKTGKIEKK